MAINIEKLTTGAVRVESLRPDDEDFAYLRSTEKCAVEVRPPYSTPI
jgi:DNA-binding transcriptional regulator YdaS (Cro superfamily)